jgi:hypothetical protein
MKQKAQPLNYGAAICLLYRNLTAKELILLRDIQREKLNEIEIAVRSRQGLHE